jgi:hypothetical protein
MQKLDQGLVDQPLIRIAILGGGHGDVDEESVPCAKENRSFLDQNALLMSTWAA